MEEYKRLKSQIDEKTYKELELFWINNLNLSDDQSSKFITLIEKINKHSKEIKSKQIKEKNNND